MLNSTNTMKHHEHFLHLKNSYLGTLPVKLLSLDDDDDDPGLWSAFLPRVSVALGWGFLPSSSGFFFSVSLSSLPSPKMSSTCQRVEESVYLPGDYSVLIFHNHWITLKSSLRICFKFPWRSLSKFKLNSKIFNTASVTTLATF